MEVKIKTSLDKSGSTKLLKRFVFSDPKTKIEGCVWVPQTYDNEQVEVEVRLK
jgi:hypothetical protein